MKESEMMLTLIDNLVDLSPIEFVEEYNRQENTHLPIDSIEWNGLPECLNA